MYGETHENRVIYTTESGHKTTAAQQANSYRYRNLVKALNGLSHATLMPDEIIAEMGLDKTALRDLYYSAKESNTQLSHIYTLCPSCFKALSNRAPRTKNQSYEECSICGCNPEHDFKTHKSSHVHSRHKLSLKEAKAKLSNTHPELFI